MVVIGASLKLHADEYFHQEFNALLNSCTEDGLVNYAKIKNNDSLLVSYLDKLNQVSEAEYEKWDKWSQMAFWINAYNAITIYGITSNYPIGYGSLLDRARFPKNSIRQIKNFWDTDFSDVFGKNITLNQIEHEILRKKFSDPRIHFSLVCASIGCPELRNYAYRGDSLDWQLDNDARQFIGNSDKVRLDTVNNIIYLSSIFKWYSDDFTEPEYRELLNDYDDSEQGIIFFITKYMPEERKNYITERSPRIEYLDYDWSLNELKE